MLKELKEMQDFLEISPGDDPSELTERLTVLNTYMARSGALLARAKYMQDEAIEKVYNDHSDTIVRMSATIASKYIGSICKDENHLVNWLDRINRSCVHQAENIRTQISFAKSQLELTRKGY